MKYLQLIIILFLFIPKNSSAIETHGSCDGYKKNTYRFPMAINISYSASNSGISIMERQINKNIYNNINTSSGSKDEVGSDFLKMLFKKDYDSVIKLSKYNSFSERKDAENFVNFYHQAFNGLQDFYFISDICIGDYVIAVWKVKTAKGWYVRSFKFDARDGLFIYDTNGNNKLENKLEPIIRKIFQLKEDGIDTKFTIPNSKFNKNISIIEDSENNTIVSLILYGQKILVDIFNKKEINNKKNDRILNFYSKLMNSFKNDDYKNIEHMLSKESFSKFKQWHERTDKLSYNMVINQLVGDKNIFLCYVDIDKTTTLIFYSNDSNSIELKEILSNNNLFKAKIKENPYEFKKYSIKHLWVTRNATSQGFKLENFFTMSLVDDLFDDFDMFLLPILLHYYMT